jgi:hypothetical protein
MMLIETFRDKLLPLRAQAEIINDWLRQRLETILPEIMAREGFDMWIVIAREYNEDPVIMTLLPQPAMSARRRTILVFYQPPSGSFQRLSLDRYGYDGFYDGVWDAQEDQFQCLARLIEERDPQRIGINTAADFAFGDGLTHHEYPLLRAAVGDQVAARLHSAERLCVGWLERRLPAEIAAYPALIEMGHALIADAFSTRVIHPGITRAEDVVWWLRQKMHDLGLRAWFQPTVEIQAVGQRYDPREGQRTVILPGDLLHCDVGFLYLGLATDQQQHGYVLRPGESDAPAGLRAALAAGNRLQDIHLAAMRPGRTGNEILRGVLEQARAEGINPSVYSHPIGYHGHAAGPIIGLWDQQEGVPGRGDYPLVEDTCYSIELNVKHAVPEWDDQEVRIALEEDAALTDGSMRWLHGRQTRFHLIG